METHQYSTYPISVTRSILDDGLTVWTAERPSKLITAQIVFSVGSLDDGAYPGTAHFLEHIRYEGPARDGVHPALHSLIINGADGGASTSSTCTEYWCRGLAEDLPSILAALHEIAFRGDVDSEAVDRERTVIIQEIGEHARRDRSFCWFQQTLFPDVLATHHTPASTPKSVAAIDANILYAFWHRWYQPNRAAIIVTGGITHAQVLEAIARITRPSSIIDCPPRRSRLVPKFTRATYNESDGSPCVECYFPSPENVREQMLLNLAAQILTGYPFGILTQRLRHEQRIVYGVAAENFAWPKIGTMITVHTQPQHFAHVEEEILAGIDRLVHDEFPKKVFDAVRGQRRIFFATQAENQNGAWTEWLLQHWIEGMLEDIDIPTFILNATREDIAAAAARYLTRERYGVIHTVALDDATPQHSNLMHKDAG